MAFEAWISVWIQAVANEINRFSFKWVLEDQDSGISDSNHSFVVALYGFDQFSKKEASAKMDSNKIQGKNEKTLFVQPYPKSKLLNVR